MTAGERHPLTAERLDELLGELSIIKTAYAAKQREEIREGVSMLLARAVTAEAETVDLDRAEELLRRLQSLMPLADLKGFALSREYTRRGLVSGALRAIGRHVDQKDAHPASPVPSVADDPEAEA